MLCIGKGQNKVKYNITKLASQQTKIALKLKSCYLGPQRQIYCRPKRFRHRSAVWNRWHTKKRKAKFESFQLFVTHSLIYWAAWLCGVNLLFSDVTRRSLFVVEFFLSQLHYYFLVMIVSRLVRNIFLKNFLASSCQRCNYKTYSERQCAEN